ncbi:hypothetical protein V8G54_003398 [Vigna mungo]|uniref:Uncharacterized protein n=1 Tax=Vigna mungo TaxID=3915 RepID=A0AAQ3PCC9_VIGMU
MDTIHVVESVMVITFCIRLSSLCSSLPLSSTSIFLNILCSPKPLVFFMGVSFNPKVFLSDKDLKGANFVDLELGFLVPNEGCQSFIHLFKLKHLTVQEHHQQQDNKDRHQEQQNQHQRNSIIVSTKLVCPITFKLDIPSSYMGSGNEDDDGYTTPTSSDNKIPVIPECPGVPKKTKPKPASKRKACR